MDCSLPGSSVRGISQARILEWVAIPFSRGSSWPRDWTQVSGIAGGFFAIWATKESPPLTPYLTKNSVLGIEGEQLWAEMLSFLYSKGKVTFKFCWTVFERCWMNLVSSISKLDHPEFGNIGVCKNQSQRIKTRLVTSCLKNNKPYSCFQVGVSLGEKSRVSWISSLISS